jgi:hypothetical protein
MSGTINFFVSSSFWEILPFLGFLVLYALFVLLIRFPIALGYKKRAKEKIPALFYLVNATSYRFENLLNRRGLLCVYFLGQYKSYKIKCQFFTNSRKFLLPKKGNFINLTINTKLTKSKIQAMKFIVEYPKVYKDYVFDGKKIYLLGCDLGEEPISKDRAIEILDDMIKACELVENPNFQVNLT